jgi:FtsP/CotA-like multicopper oxidase with cupredoxin domain
VIAVDGKPVTQIFPYNGFVLAPGNRIDLDITIPAGAQGHTYLVEDEFTRNRFPLASLKVKEVQPIQTPVLNPPTAEDFLSAELFADATPSKTWDLDAIRGGQYGIEWAMNRLLWPDSDSADIRLGQPQKIVFNNNSSRLHPMHIHGTFFRVLERNGKPEAEPFTRDTVLVSARESVVIGLVPTEPGIWLSHCHIQSHAEAGMMTTVNVAPQNQN